MHSPTPWTFEEMFTSIVVRDANGRTVCNLPRRTDKERRRANAELIVAAVNGLPTVEPPKHRNPDLPHLLRTIAGSIYAKEHVHDKIFNAAADELDHWRKVLLKAEAN